MSFSLPTVWTRLRSAALARVRQLGARAYLVFAVVFSLLILTDQGFLNLVASADTKLFDSLISHRLIAPKADPDIVILDIDEASLASMAKQHGRWPWPNQVLGELVRGIETQKPQAIVFDILFSDADIQRPASDAAFNQAIADSSSTFFPMLRLDPQNDPLSRIPVSALPGVKALQDNADVKATIAIILPKVPAAIDNGRLGTHQVVPDKDGVIRRYPAWLTHARWQIPSLPMRIAQEFKFAGADQAEVLLNWRGPPFTYQYLSFADVYQDLMAAKPQRAANEFAGKIVIIGSTAPSLFDVKGTPLARIHPGVEILATAIDNFKHGDYLRERPRWVMLLAALLLIWSMAIALYRQTRIEVFDKVFGVLQVGLVGIAYVTLNLSDWYVDTSAPLSLGLLYFAIARIYYGLSLKWLANAKVRDINTQGSGQRLLAVLAIRWVGSSAQERRAFKGDLDHLVARSALQAGRISNLIEDPGLVQSVFADSMLVYWLCEDLDANWQADAAQLTRALRESQPEATAQGRLLFASSHAIIGWETTAQWTQRAFATILAALQGTSALDHSPPQDVVS
jgi:hypothetical protein